jgi:hypothetical protein
MAAADLDRVFFVWIVSLKRKLRESVANGAEAGRYDARRPPGRKQVQALADQAGELVSHLLRLKSLLAMGSTVDLQKVAEALFEFSEKPSLAGAVVVVVPDAIGVLNDDVVNVHRFGSSEAM